MNRALKGQIVAQILDELDTKIRLLKSNIETIKEGRNNDTKSSAGDKFETSREMAQVEMDKQVLSLQRQLKMKDMLLQIDTQKMFEQIEMGSLVETNKGIYLMSIGYGKITIDSVEVYAISLISPLGQACIGKRKGERFVFQKQEMGILDIQ